MKKFSCFLFAFFFLSLTLVDAQIMRRLRDAAERGVSRAVERRVESEMEKVAQRQLEKIFGEIYGPEGMPGVDWEKVLSGISADVPVADSYDFTGYTVMEMTSTNERGRETESTKFKSFFSDSDLIIGMEIQTEEKGKSEGVSILIYDLERNATIILFDNEGEKARMAYGFDFETIASGIEFEDDEEGLLEGDFQWKKTGNKKVILGHSCDEYIGEDDEGKATYWITEKPLQGKSGFWGQSNPFLNAKMKGENQDYFRNMPQGNLMEMIYESKTDQSAFSMTVTEINENSKLSFVMADYPSAFAGMRED